MGEAAGSRAYLYRIDREDRITHVNSAWLSFAEENWNIDLGRGVLQRPIWDFIADTETRHIFRAMLAKVRESRRTISVPFRCDSPHIRRFMEMEIVPLPDNNVQFNCSLLRTERRPYMGLLDPASDRSDEYLTMCSWCKRIRLGADEWVEVEEAVKRLDLFESEGLPQLTHGLCNGCYEIAMEKIKEARTDKGTDAA